MAEYSNPFAPKRRVGSLDKQIVAVGGRVAPTLAEKIATAGGREAPAGRAGSLESAAATAGRVAEAHREAAPRGVVAVAPWQPGGLPGIVKENPADLGVRVPLPQRSRHWEGTTEAKDLQRSQAAQQIALARGMDTGGRGMRMGGQAAARSRVESQAVVSMIREAEEQGYTTQEANAAGLLAMDEAQFEQAMDSILGGYIRKTEAQKAEDDAAFWQGLGSAMSMLYDVYKKLTGNPLKDGGVVPGTGSGDTVPALLTPGELVIPKDLSAQLMEVMNRNAGGGKEVYRAQTGGMVRRDPQTGYLMEDPTAMALQTMTLLREQNERIKELEKGRK